MPNRASIVHLSEMETQFDGEWVLIEDLVTDGDEVVAGRVTAHSPQRDVVYASAEERDVRDAAVLFMGTPAYEGELMLSLRHAF